MLQFLAWSFITKPVMIAAIIAASVLVEAFLIAVIVDATRKAMARKLNGEAEEVSETAFVEALTADQKKYYEAILERVNETKDITVKATAADEEFRLGKFRVLRLLLKNGNLFAQLVTYGKDFQAQVFGGHADAEFSLNVISVDSASAVRDVKTAFGRVLASVPNV